MKCVFRVYYRNWLSEADVIVGGRYHMLRVKELHSHATPSRNDVKIALPSTAANVAEGMRVCDIVGEKRDPDYLMIRPLRFY